MSGKILSVGSVARKLRDTFSGVVLTCGCFDLFHLGHLRTLQASSEFGRTLVVAVNDDATVRQLKGSGRPIVPEKERMEIIASLECVNYVVLLNQISPESMITALRPNVFTKGGSTPYGSFPCDKFAKDHSVRLVRIRCAEPVSTTSRVQDICKTYCGETS